MRVPTGVPVIVGLALLVVVIMMAASAARADTVAELTTATGAPDVVERRHSDDITLDGPVAEVVTRQVFAGRGERGASELVYRYALPDDAVVTGLEVVPAGGRAARGLIVDATAAITPLPRADVLAGAPDLALLRQVALGDGVIIYELRVYPVPAGREVTVTTRWVAPTRFDGGRLALRVPGRGRSANLAASDVHVTALPLTGAAGFRELVGDGAVLRRDAAGRVDGRFTASHGGDVMVAAMPRLTGRKPVAQLASAPLGDGRSALALAVLAPPPAPAQIPDYERVLFLIDVSASLGETGRAATRALVSEVLATLPDDMRMEAILFARTATRLFGSLVPVGKERSRAVDDAIARAPLESGSDLGAALALVRTVLVKERTAEEETTYRRLGAVPRTLVVIVSDGLVPLALTGERAMDRYGRDLFDHAFVVALTTFPDGGLPPGVADAPAGALALRAGGRSIVVREGEAQRAGREIAAELAQPAPLRGLSLDAGATPIDGLDLPGELAPGQGVVVFGTALGVPPQKVTLRAFVGGDAAEVVVPPARGLLARALVPLWLGRETTNAFVPLAERVEDGEASDYPTAVWARARAAHLALTQRAGAVTSESALVVVAPDDALARDRAAFAARWGASEFGAMPPPPRPGRVPPAAAELAPGGIGRGRRAPRTVVRGTRILGELDDGLVRDLLRRSLVPRARACYQKALQQDQKLAGRVDLVLELGRGEVTSVTIAATTFQRSDVDLCVVEAGYDLQVPRVAAEFDDGTVVVVRYPLTFRRLDDGIDVRDDAPKVTPQTMDPARGGTPLSRDDAVP